MRQKADAVSQVDINEILPPLDRAHLSRQVMGDPALEDEVLRMFVRQALTALDEIGQATGEERARLAHRLKGAARGVGAFAIAECAGSIEAFPDDDGPVMLLSRHVVELTDFLKGTDADIAENPR